MAPPLFDTYRAVSALKEAGCPDEQAVAVVDTIGGALTGGLAAKADLTEVKAGLAEMKAGMTDVKAQRKGGVAVVKAKATESKAESYRLSWLIVMGIAGMTVALTVALVKLLP